jgi:hypothetical protein
MNGDLINRKEDIMTYLKVVCLGPFQDRPAGSEEKHETLSRVSQLEIRIDYPKNTGLEFK